MSMDAGAGSVFTDAFKADLAKLNILEPNVWCKATDHISEQIAFVKELEEKDSLISSTTVLF